LTAVVMKVVLTSYLHSGSYSFSQEGLHFGNLMKYGLSHENFHQKQTKCLNCKNIIYESLT